MGVLASAIMLSSISMTGGDLIPIETFETPNISFTCDGPEMLTAGIWYGGGYKIMDYYDLIIPVSFVLKEPVQTVRYKEDGERKEWLIEGKGEAMQVKGLADGTTVTMTMHITRAAYGDLVADFHVKAGDYQREGHGCKLIPTRFRVTEPPR